MAEQAPGRIGPTPRDLEAKTCWICGDQMPFAAMDAHWKTAHTETTVEVERYIKRVKVLSVVLVAALIVTPIILFVVFPEYYDQSFWTIIFGVVIAGVIALTIVIVVLLNIILPRKIDRYRVKWQQEHPGNIPKRQ